jgi:hypothetical protein
MFYAYEDTSAMVVRKQEIQDKERRAELLTTYIQACLMPAHTIWRYIWGNAIVLLLCPSGSRFGAILAWISLIMSARQGSYTPSRLILQQQKYNLKQRNVIGPGLTRFLMRLVHRSARSDA